MRLGSDTGGTFTDIVTSDGRIHKVLSTPDDPSRAVLTGAEILSVDLGPDVLLVHGTTVATNALLQRSVARTALVTTTGMADVIEIARQDRPSLYDATARRPTPLVHRGHRFEVAGRLDSSGEELEPVAGVPDVPGDIEAVAVCLLHADLNPAHEREVAAALAARGLEVCCSHEVSPEFREYERTVTTVINASLRPLVRRYLEGLRATGSDVQVMTSAGGLLSAETAGELPAALLLSGPAGGVRAAAAVAAAHGFADAVTIDMGGTSTDVGLILDGEPAPAAEREVGGFTVRFPSLDVITIGAGGGSIAALDPGGALVVGPRSAGADPGPASYGRGGTEPTVTDANVAAGRIPTGAAFGGIELDRGRAIDALDRAAIDAAGVLAVVNANMERALRAATIERGVDPRSLVMVAFGGAGPLHAADLADALGIDTVLIPARAGVLSAVGILTAPIQRDLVRSWPTPDDHAGLGAALGALGAEAARLVGTAEDGDEGDGDEVDGPDVGAGGRGVEVVTAVDCRYRGQSHEITVASVVEFEAEHRRRNGYTRPGDPIEVVAVRASATLPAPLGLDDLEAPVRALTDVVGPATVSEPDCTVWVPEGWRTEAGVAGALVLRRVGS